MIAQIARSFANSPFSARHVDEDSLVLERANYFVCITKVGDNELDVWIEGPYGDSDVVLTNPNGLDIVINDLYDENYAQLGLSNYRDESEWV